MTEWKKDSSTHYVKILGEGLIVCMVDTTYTVIEGEIKEKWSGGINGNWYFFNRDNADITMAKVDRLLEKKLKILKKELGW
jgi:hypothetical protein